MKRTRIITFSKVMVNTCISIDLSLSVAKGITAILQNALPHQSHTLDTVNRTTNDALNGTIMGTIALVIILGAILLFTPPKQLNNN